MNICHSKSTRSETYLFYLFCDNIVGNPMSMSYAIDADLLVTLTFDAKPCDLEGKMQDQHLNCRKLYLRLSRLI